jgi:UDP-N-acetylmuramoylalanine--D-glutamate ligase
MDFSHWEGKKVSVIGARETGVQSAIFLKQKGASVFLSELKESKELLETKKTLDSYGIECEFGHHSWEELKDSDLFIISPGIPPSADIYQKMVRSKIPIWSEIELAYRFCPAQIIAVTGSNGKTTVTTLIRDVLRASGRRAVSCGNIGNSFIGEMERLTPETTAVVEVSSFQLSHIDQFKPSVAVLLNLSPNHMDWHGSFESYAQEKLRIFKNQTAEDYAFINVLDIESMKRTQNLTAQTIYFNSPTCPNPNYAAVRAVAELFHIESQVVDRVLDQFLGLEHRFELAGTFNGVQYVNDSKSTTIASLGWALDRVEKDAVLIAGGRHKGGDFRVLRDLVQKKIKFLVALGESRKEIEAAFSDLVSVYAVESLEEALRAARAATRPGQTVLFSPACASFDMFRDYQDRGKQFKAIISSWEGELSQFSGRQA